MAALPAVRRVSRQGPSADHPQRKAIMAEHHAVAAGHADSAAPEAALPEVHSQGRLLDPRPRLDRRRLRRYRHQPALRLQARSVAAAAGGRMARPSSPASIIIGVLSLILWSLILIVTIKYVRPPAARRQQGRGRHADPGRPGAARARRAQRGIVLFLGMAGAALFYGDAVITPAISVLSAVEGLKLAAPGPRSPTSCRSTLAILIALFAVQSRGTGKVAAFFGPLMLALVPRPWRGLGFSTSPTTRRSCSPSTPIYGVIVLRQPPGVSLRGPRRGLPGGHRRRGALCRSRPFRPRADPRRLALLRLPGAGPQLSRPGRAGPRRPGRRPRTPSSGSCPTGPCLPLVDPGHARHHHRQPGGDHRRLLADPAGGPARPAAAPRDPLHLGNAIRARSTCRA